jgi:hypothetical protein
MDGEILAPGHLHLNMRYKVKKRHVRDTENQGEHATLRMLVAEHTGTWRTFSRFAADDTHGGMEKQLRRSRMRRTRTDKRLELTKRDIEIFGLLRQYRYLRSTYLHVFVGGASETRFKERLGDLFHEGYLDRPEQQWLFADARYRPAVYELGRGAERVLDGAGTCDDPRTSLIPAPRRQFLHSLMVSELLASLELGARCAEGIRFIGWKEALSRAPETEGAPLLRLPLTSGGYLAPDGLFGLEYCCNGARSYRFFALEADRGTMPIARSDMRQTSLVAKFGAYTEVITQRLFKKHWGLPNLLVAFVTSEATRSAVLVESLKNFGAAKQAFLIKSITETALCKPKKDVLLAPWARPACTDFYICE